MIQTLFLLGFSVALVFWGGSGLLVMAIAAACIGAAAFLLVRQSSLGLPSNLWMALSALTLWLLVCYSGSANGIFGWKVLVTQIMYVICFLIAALTAKDESDRKRFLAALCVLCSVEIAFGYYRFLDGSTHVLGLKQPGEYFGRMSGTFISPNHFAALAGITGMLFAGFAMASGRKIPRILLAIASALAFGGIVLSGSRIGSVAAALVLGTLILSPRAPLVRRIRISVLAIGILILLGSYLFQMGSTHRMMRGFQDPSLSARTVVWSDTVGLCLERPWTGYGLGNFQWYYPTVRSAGITRKVDFAHSDLLQTWSEQGFIGLILWVAFFVFCGFIRPRKTEPLDVAVCGAVGIVLAMAIVDFPFQSPAVGMATFALLGTSVKIEERWVPPAAARCFLLMPLVVLMVVICRVIVGQSMLHQADVARKQLRWDDALAKYRAAVRWNPGNSLVWKWMGELSTNKYLFSRKTNHKAAQEAQGFFRRSLEINGRDGSVRVAQGRLLMDSTQSASARASYLEALNLDPRNGFFHDVMAKWFISQKRFGEAKAHLNMALWLYPRDEFAMSLRQKIDREENK